MTKRKQYVDDWDYGISGSDDERKSPEPSTSGKSKSDKNAKAVLGESIQDDESGQADQTMPPHDPKDPAAAYFFLVSVLASFLAEEWS